MAFGRRRGAWTGSHTGPAGTPSKDWIPDVNKDPFYRTMDIMNGVFKTRMKLQEGPNNSTDCATVININFKETRERQIIEDLGHDGGKYYRAKLECGHILKTTVESKFEVGKTAKCVRCGAEGAYQGLEHEWSHKYFHSSPAVSRLFVEKYMEEIKAQIQGVDQGMLKTFLFFFDNVFDDIRVNSLQQCIFPGSAQRIWNRWRRVTEERKDYNTNFLAFMFAVALEVPIDPQGEFAPLYPVVKWATDHVRGKGPATKYTIIRWCLDRCLGALLAHLPPPPPQALQPQQQPNQQGDPNGESSTQAGSGNGQDEEEGSGQAGAQGSVRPEEGQGHEDSGDEPGEEQRPGSLGTPGDQQQQRAGNGSPGQRGSAVGGPPAPRGAGSGSDQEAGAAEEDQVDPSGSSGGALPDNPPPDYVPSGAALAQKDIQGAIEAFQKLMGGAGGMDPGEEHPQATDEQMEAFKKDPAANYLLGALSKALQSAIDNKSVEQDAPVGQVDQDMMAQLQKLQTLPASPSKDSFLTSDAKARLRFIDVMPQHVSGGYVKCSEVEKFGINRMRSAFHKVLGRQRMKRSSSGNSLDIQSLIQFLAGVGGLSDEDLNEGGSSDDEVFEVELTNKGFSYRLLSDMSGSMSGSPFQAVCHANEMLKESLRFPFVQGDLWGFRGGEGIQGPGTHKSPVEDGEVWLYRYHKDCKGYIGASPMVRGKKTGMMFPVECGGITPMNSAIRVAVKDMLTQPDGMVKRLFLLTDGSPLQVKTTGRMLPERLLRQFVKNEIEWARKKGVQVITLVIGHGISDDDCNYMFGKRSTWKRVGTGANDALDKVLPQLVIENFSKFLKSR